MMPAVIDKNFSLAIDILLKNEGGYADVKGDRGGSTNYGISLRFLRNLPEGDINKDGTVDSKDIQHLTRDEAIAFYWREYWNKYGYYNFLDWAVAAKVLDLSVNIGPFPSHKLLQQALLAAEIKIKIDGKLGKQTFRAVNNANRDILLAALRSEAAGYYRLISGLNPDYQQFLSGWLNRAYS